MNDIKENNFFIPNKLAVGFQKRKDTYTGKLGYVTYYDHTNTLRKETSWKSWKNDDIDPLYIDNEPTEGFILNKNIGGGRGWDSRVAWTRIWDPRGFEFEISTENLLWLLEWNGCEPGKKLIGKYVYSWYGTELVLMPIISDDYKASMEVSNRMYSKSVFKEKDLVPGTLYRAKGKEDNDVIFIGKVETCTAFGRNPKKQLLFINGEKGKTKYVGVPVYLGAYSSDHCKYEDVSNIIIYKTPASIIAELTPNYITQEEVDTYIERFNVSPFSTYFWNNIANIVDKFITRHPQIHDCLDSVKECTFVGQCTKNGNRVVETVTCTEFERAFKKYNHLQEENSYDNRSVITNNALCLRSVISKDGRQVTLYNPIKVSPCEPYVPYKHMYKYGFINLDSREKCFVDYGDLGKPTQVNTYGNYTIDFSYNVDNELVRKAKASCIPIDVNVDDNRNVLYYVTKNGYVSDILQRMLNTWDLSFVDNEKKVYGAGFVLPKKVTE